MRCVESWLRYMVPWAMSACAVRARELLPLLPHKFNVCSGHDHALAALESNLEHARFRA